MTFAHALGLIGLAAVSLAPATAGASDTIRHMKGHGSLPAAAAPVKGPKAACHPDPSKSRACRHHQAQATAAERAVEASAPTFADASPAR